ncbi:hypothetical protein CEP54_007509 [Fusarium duplospermum]|uniref:Uncharacterized protein n=1 Tax=Fusarium duplospermum TaxID=1325734 RepID=A0A428Q124_9HYPO|nr:hypothetical protein CEP54_007509 [Fusarium duplospermum]
MSRKTTILDELTQPNLAVMNRANGGTNTTQSYWPDIGSWIPWQDFTAPKLYALFADVVDSEWTVRSCLRTAPTDWDGEFFDEDELEHSIITPQILPPVNAALRHALRYIKLDKTHSLNLGRAGRTYYEPGGDRRFKADWALCSPIHRQGSDDNNLRYENLLPGDSKLSNKWHSSWYGSSDPTIQEAWKDPVRQILHYSDKTDRRYGFLITDAELVVMRITQMPTSTGIASTRSPREQPSQGHSYSISSSTDISMLSGAMRDMSMPSSSSHKPGGPATDGHRIEYRAIPMENHGKGKRQLTVHLALFYLTWMAGMGQGSLSETYPGFDSSWPLLDGTFIHNTTGLLLKKAKNIEYPNPSREDRGPAWVTVGSQEDGEPALALTLESVVSLEITEYQGRHFYYYVNSDQPTLVTSEMPVYDEMTGEFGYFEGLVWTVGSRTKKKRRTTGNSRK